MEPRRTETRIDEEGRLVWEYFRNGLQLTLVVVAEHLVFYTLTQENSTIFITANMFAVIYTVLKTGKDKYLH